MQKYEKMSSFTKPKSDRRTERFRNRIGRQRRRDSMTQEEIAEGRKGRDKKS